MILPKNIEELLASNQNFEYYFFLKGPFSQWQKSPFISDNCFYSNCEQYMMAEKAKLFNDLEIRDEIFNTTSPKDIQTLGRKIRNFDQEIWNSHKRDIVLKGNLAKFSQNDLLYDSLISTENRILVEVNPVDKIWGIGLSSSDKEIFNPKTWKGENLLGFILTEVRESLKNSHA
jgi:hypothetical protein